MNNSRAFLVLLGMLALFSIIIVKLVNIQLIQGDELKYFAERQQMKIEKIQAERGLIYDRNNVLLAYNKNDATFYLDLSQTNRLAKKELAKKFSKLTKKTPQFFLTKMKGKNKTITLAQNIQISDAKDLMKLKLPGYYYRKGISRVYYYHNFASHILGYVNSQFKGVNGVENYFNSQLAGINGQRLVERDAKGKIITVKEDKTKNAVPGNNLFLTIDKTYQKILEEELTNGLKKYGGNYSLGIIMNPNNGEILALANTSGYDPNSYWKYNDAERKDRAVTDTYEPGSTFKSITLAALLDQNLVKENDKVFAENGRYKFYNTYVTDTHKRGWLTVSEVIKYSSNIGIAKLVRKIDNEIYYKYLRGFGFGNYTSVSLPGEVKGKLKKPDQWSRISKEFMSFGYEIAVTPIQLISAYSALVNGGTLFKPQIIKKITDASGNIVYNSNPDLVRTVISKNTSRRIRKILSTVVEGGTGINAKIKFINAGGKTGTSQRLINGKYSKSQYNSSFIGFFPVDNPQIITLILVNSPKIGRYGGQVAAPIFKKISERIIKNNYNKFLEKKENIIPVKNIKAVYVKKNYKTKGNLKRLNLDFTGDISKARMNVMPNLINRTLSDAISILTKLGIRFKVSGSGKIVKQSIRPGTKLRTGLLCKVDAKETSLKGVKIY
ncbi:MAG TPA: PASTA domain-containing protein [Ignavibacteria bacterium]|nr:PASTA domain-containing protein [Ignavibacteria bacterium]